MQPLDLISGALLDIGARAAGELPAPEDTSEAFILMNLMLDQWSNEKMMIFCTQEVIHELTASKYIYQIGPPGSGLTPDIGASFTGQIVNDAGGGILTVTSLTSGALSVGQIINARGNGDNLLWDGYRRQWVGSDRNILHQSKGRHPGKRSFHKLSAKTAAY